MSTLRAPTPNPTLCQVRQVHTRDGITRLALAMDMVSNAVRWFTLAELATVNSRLAIAECVSILDHAQSVKEIASGVSDERFEAYMQRTGDLYQEIDAALRANTSLVVELTPDLAANVNHAIGCTVKVVQPVSLFHEAMVAA